MHHDLRSPGTARLENAVAALRSDAKGRVATAAQTAMASQIGFTYAYEGLEMGQSAWLRTESAFYKISRLSERWRVQGLFSLTRPLSNMTRALNNMKASLFMSCDIYHQEWNVR